jgi:hypothetical protein
MQPLVRTLGQRDPVVPTLIAFIGALLAVLFVIGTNPITDAPMFSDHDTVLVAADDDQPAHACIAADPVAIEPVGVAVIEDCHAPLAPGPVTSPDIQTAPKTSPPAAGEAVVTCLDSRCPEDHLCRF